MVNDPEQAFLRSLGNLDGKVAIVTGNRERSLHNIARAEEALPKTRGPIKFHQLDLSSIKGAKWSAQEFMKLENRLDIVVANAGISMLNLSELSQDGYEMMFAINHIGHFTFITTLLGRTLQTCHYYCFNFPLTQDVTSSIGYRFATGLDYTSLTTARPGDGDSVWDVKPAFVRYGNSKLANIYFANELAKRLREDGFKNVFSNSCHPGFAGATGLGQGGFRAWGGAWAESLIRLLMKPLNTVEDASKTQTYLAANVELAQQNVHGQYWAPVWSWTQRYIRCQPEELTNLGKDQEEQKKLWDFSERAVQGSCGQARLPPSRAIISFLTRSRFLLIFVLAAIAVILWRGITSSASEMQRFYCWGPSIPPVEMSANEQAQWHAHLQTPVLFNHHAPIAVDSTSIQHIDLNGIMSTPRALVNEERVLILTPLKDAAPYLSKYFDLLSELTYRHDLIDLAFIVSDSADDTLAVLSAELDRVQKRPDKIPFRSAMIVEKDFGAIVGPDVHDRHGFEAQGPRRKSIGRARNYLLYTALKPEHSWVYWRDVDIQDSPSKILEDFMEHNKDILVPNIWFHRYEHGRDIEGKFDYNSWQESDEGLRLAASLDKDVILAEGYKEFNTHRKYLAKMGDWRNNKDVEVQLDGVGGVNVLVKADVHRSGINFPCYAFENQAETEGFAKMAKRAGYQVVGLPNYVIWHIDTQEKQGNLGGRPA
ncbi:MAG: hypothetical protein Q9211_001758 [Gyalolechia sp. 1 TL-2023]